MTEKPKDSLWIKALVFGLFVLMSPVLICAMDGLATLLNQAFGWFRTGVWVPKDFWSGVNHWFLTDRPSVSWVIPNRALNWMLDGPRWIWMLVWAAIIFAVEMAVIVVGANYAEKVGKRWQARKDRRLG